MCGWALFFIFDFSWRFDLFQDWLGDFECEFFKNNNNSENNNLKQKEKQCNFKWVVELLKLKIYIEISTRFRFDAFR